MTSLSRPRFAWAWQIAATALASLPVHAASVAFQGGGASGTDPLGHAYRFDGTTFTFASGRDGFNPAGTAIGEGTGARSFSFSLTGAIQFEPNPVGLSYPCPPGAVLVWTSSGWTCVKNIKNPGPRLVAMDLYRLAPGTLTFDLPDGEALVRGESAFEFVLQFAQPVPVDSLTFNAAWSDVAAVPELPAVALLPAGLALLAWRRRRPC